MDSSRRAVESYWRSKTIDGVTSDEDKVAPVYKLEEICDLLRSSHLSIVKEISEFILRRLQHKSPIVKQKALRLIKYAVGKAGTEFRREMQRNSVAVRQLIHHKGQPDPLKGDALNKAVRDTAQEALSAIFAGDDNNKPAPAETSLTQRIQGFGNTNFDMPSSEDKKSFLSEVVGIGSATIKQGLTSLTQAQTPNKNDTGSYRSPNLRRSLTTESSYSDRNESFERRIEAQPSSLLSKNVSGGSWGQDMKTTVPETTNGNPSSSYSDDKSREERLLETIVTNGGVRLQPTRDVLQVFLVEASKLDAVALCRALESKLQSHLWQVRMKAICVLEALLRKKDDEHFLIVASYFIENEDVVVKCSESPQASLREKANKVLAILNSEQSGSRLGQPVKMEAAIQMPDLIDTLESYGNEASNTAQKDEGITTRSISNTSLIDDLFNDGFSSSVSNSEPKNADDPFSDVLFHTQADKEEHTAADLFSGMSTVDELGVEGFMEPKSGAELFDIFGSNSGLPQAQENPKKDVNDLMAGLFINKNDSLPQQNRASAGGFTEAIFSDSTVSPSNQVPTDVLNGMFASQGAGMNTNPLFQLNPMAYNNLSSGLVLNPLTFPTQPINYGAMGSLFAQQQFLATMSNLQQMGNLPSQPTSVSHTSGTQVGGYPSALPDIFNPSTPTHTASSLMNSSKKEDTRAFDFISDHVAAARDPKRVN